MTLRVTIKLDNEAFSPDPGFEVSRILRNLAAYFQEGPVMVGDERVLMDFNGNRVGLARVTHR